MPGRGSQPIHFRVAFAIALGFAASVSAQPVIEHQDVDCLPRGEFTRILTAILPPSAIRAAKLYFRSQLYPDFYFVELTRGDDGVFGAVLPLPSSETSTVIYYIEAVDVSFQATRTEERSVAVSEGPACQRGRGGMLFSGTSPGILVGATQAGASAIPAGFQAVGITGFLTSAGGIAATGGSGIGIGGAVGAVAGAAAGVGVVLGRGGETASTTTVPPAGGGRTTSTSVSSSSTTTTSMGGSSSTTSSGPSTSTSSSGPSTSTSSSGPSTSTSTSPSTTTTPPSLVACFEWRALGSCRVFFDSCSTPESLIQRYEWRMLATPVPEPPQIDSFTFSFEADPRCQGTMNFNYPVRLTVFDSLARSASVQQNVSVQPGMTYRTLAGASVNLSFTSRLSTSPPDGRTRGQIAVNGARLSPSDNASPSRLEAQVGTGVVRIEATLLTPATPGSFWELDFSSSESLVAGSLKSERGTVVSSDDRRIVFRLNGDPGETFRCRLEVR